MIDEEGQAAARRDPRKRRVIAIRRRSRSEPKSLWSKCNDFVKQPIAATLITFFLTGVVATLFSNNISDRAKARESAAAAQMRAIDSVKSITDMIYERAFRAGMLASAILRSASDDEIKPKKDSYDSAYARYNSSIQSNLFRVREMFGTTQYTPFERLLEVDLRKWFVAQDDCITAAFDDLRQHTANSLQVATLQLKGCMYTTGGPIDIGSLDHSTLDCGYAYSDGLYRFVLTTSSRKSLIESIEEEVHNACRFPATIPKPL